MSLASRVTLGTAQLGLDYGVTHSAGPMQETQALAVLARAKALGIQWLDTAAAYGRAEAVLGQLMHPRAGEPTLSEQSIEPADFKICTKVIWTDAGADPVATAQQQLDASLERLGRTQVDVLMIHDAKQLLGAYGAGLHRWLLTQKAHGKAHAVGASVYDGAQALAVVAHTGPQGLDWIQLPLNVLDQRSVRDGTLEQLKAHGLSIQARSALLQGLLLADPEHLPDAFGNARVPLARVRHAAQRAEVSALQLALGFVASVSQIDQIVLGVQSAAQLEECVAALATTCEASWSDLGCEDIAVIDPRRWPVGVRISG